jgi:hypothetical protein
MNDDKLETYKGFEIVASSEGFINFCINDNFIALYNIRNDKVVSRFVFAIGLLDRIAQPNLRDNNFLQQEAVKIIKKHINNNPVKNEHTYGFYSSSFLEEDNPKWWIKH